MNTTANRGMDFGTIGIGKSVARLMAVRVEIEYDPTCPNGVHRRKISDRVMLQDVRHSKIVGEKSNKIGKLEKVLCPSGRHGVIIF